MKTQRRREKGTGTIVKDRNRFYLKIRIGSKTKSTLLRGKDDRPVTTRQEAEAAARLLRPVLRAEQKEEIALHIANAKKMRHEASFPVDQIWKVYLTQYTRPDSGKGTMESYQKSLRHFTKWLAKEHPRIQRVNKITEETAAEYFSYIWTVRKVSGKTFNIYRQALKLIFSHIRIPAGLESNPFDVIESKPVQTESRLPFTEEQVNAIFDGFDSGFFYETEYETPAKHNIRRRFIKRIEYKPMFKDEMRILLLLCCWTGCRGQDGCVMRWSNVDLEHNTITYIPHKTARVTNNREVSLPLHPDLAAGLKEALTFRDRNHGKADYIIPSVANRFVYNPNGVQGDVRKIIHCATGLSVTDDECPEHRVCRANRYSLHSFRHTFVSFCVNAGVPLDVVATIVGHGNSVMTRHYAHISDAAKKNAIMALPVITKRTSTSNHKSDFEETVVPSLTGTSYEDPAVAVS